MEAFARSGISRAATGIIDGTCRSGRSAGINARGSQVLMDKTYSSNDAEYCTTFELHRHRSRSRVAGRCRIFLRCCEASSASTTSSETFRFEWSSNDKFPSHFQLHYHRSPGEACPSRQVLCILLQHSSNLLPTLLCMYLIGYKPQNMKNKLVCFRRPCACSIFRTSLTVPTKFFFRVYV